MLVNKQNNICYNGLSHSSLLDLSTHPTEEKGRKCTVLIMAQHIIHPQCLLDSRV